MIKKQDILYIVLVEFYIEETNKLIQTYMKNACDTFNFFINEIII